MLGSQFFCTRRCAKLGLWSDPKSESSGTESPDPDPQESQIYHRVTNVLSALPLPLPLPPTGIPTCCPLGGLLPVPLPLPLPLPRPLPLPCPLPPRGFMTI